MKTHFETLISGEDREYARQAAGAVFREVDRIEVLFSRFDPSSEISRINRLKRGESLLIGVETYECLSVAERIRAETGGAFDINIRARRRGGERDAAREAAVPSGESSPAFPSRQAADVGFELKKTPIGFEIRRVAANEGGWQGLNLDLGGIGKGYALDRGLAVLADWGIGRALLHAGTSTAVALGEPIELIPDASGGKAERGNPPEWETRGGPWQADSGQDKEENDAGRPALAGSQPNSKARKIEYPADSARDLTMGVAGWPVGVGGARPCPGSPTRVFLKNRALSGSGTEVKGQHIFDPRTGLPAGGHLAAWASHASAAESDALSTAFMVMSTDEVEEYCGRHPDVWALVFLFDGTCRQVGDVPQNL